MPLPWIMVFSLIFICLYSVFLYCNFYSYSFFFSSKLFSLSRVSLPW